MSHNFTEFNNPLRNRWGLPTSNTSSALLTAGTKGAQAAWSTAQIAVVAASVAIGVGAFMVAAAGLAVAAITTFNLNNYYYGEIGALKDALLVPSSPLFVNTTSSTVYLTCSPDDPFSLCAYATYINESIAVFNQFMINGTLPDFDNFTLPALGYSNGAPFMANVTNAKEAFDNLVGEALVLQAQIDALPATPTLLTLNYTNGAAFMTNVTNGKTALDNLVGEALVLQAQIDALPATPTPLSLNYTNGAAFMTNVTNVKEALDNLVGEALVQEGQIVTLQGQTTRLLTRKNTNYYVSANYGNDLTCDASASLPCATINKTMSLVPLTGEFAQATIVFDNGLYVETSYVAIKPNVVFAGNEIGTYIIFGAGAGLDGATWPSVVAGHVTFLRFGLIRCDAACTFDQSAAAPAGVFITMHFYNSTIQLNAPMTFTRGTTGNPYFAVSLESVVSTTGTITFQEMTAITWSLSGDNYSPIVINYNSTTTFNGGSPTISIDGFVSHTTVTVNNYASGLTVDWSIMGLINRDSATITRNYISGAIINVHGDVLSLGAINGGLLSTGAGSGSTQYLTLAPGLGYTPTTSGDWPTVPTNQQTANDELAARIVGITDGEQNTIHVEVFGNDATCQAGLGYPCLTLNGALAVANAHAAARVSIHLGPGIFLNPPGDTTPFRCGLDITGQDANTYLELANPTMDASSMNTYTTQCWFTLKSLQLALGGTWNFTAVGTSVTDWRVFMENVTFANSASPAYFSANSGFCWVGFIDVSANGGLGSITFTDMFMVMTDISLNNAVYIYQTAKAGFSEFHGFSIGTGGFHVINTYTSSSSSFFVYGGNNLNTLAWDFNTTAGATTLLRGDATTLGMINSGGGYGPASSGSGTLTITRETGAQGLGYTPTTSGDWSPAPTYQQTANDQLAARIKALENTPQRRFVLTFTANTTTSFAISTNVSTLYFSGCGGGSSGVGNTPGNGYGGNSGAGIIDFPVLNTGANFTVFYGAGGAGGPTSVDGQDTTISNGVLTITLEGGKSVSGANRGGHVLSGPETIITGAAGGGSPGNPAVFNGLVYGGSGGGVSDLSNPGKAGGYAALRQPRSNGGGTSGNSQGGGGGSSIFGLGGDGGTGSVPTDGAPGGLCAGGGGGGSDLVTASNGGAGGNGVLYAYYYVL